MLPRRWTSFLVQDVPNMLLAGNSECMGALPVLDGLGSARCAACSATYVEFGNAGFHPDTATARFAFALTGRTLPRPRKG